MSESKRKKQAVEEAGSNKQKNVINISGNKLRVIITKKKNSSWIDDLHTHDKLNSNNRVYH